jgi:uncharacterized protein YoxC
MEEQRALQVSHQTREMIEHGAQAMIQQAMEYMRDAIHAPRLRKENEALHSEAVELLKKVTRLEDDCAKMQGNVTATESALQAVTASRDLIAQHRDRLLTETAQLTEKLRRIRHSMDTMRGIMDSNLAA